MPPRDRRLTVLHYTGSNEDRGGIVTSVRALAAADMFDCVLGLNPGAVQQRTPPLAQRDWPPLAGENISPGNFLRARRTARAVQVWLREDAQRIFHGHSRAGLLVALWLHWWGERRVVASVHCYGRQRWFYRAAKRWLGPRLRWLTPAMRRYYYGAGAGDNWSGCVPNGLPGTPAVELRRWAGPRPLRLGGAGQLTANKRWHLVLAALARTTTPVEFWHAGGPTEDAASAACAAELRAQADRLGLGGRVRWLGWQPDLGTMLGEVDVLVVPFHGEAFSFAALEALHAGVPVLAARGGGPDDFVQEGVNGWFFAAEDAASLAAVCGRLSQPEAWRGLRNDPALLARFSAARVAVEWDEIYRTLAA